MNGGGEIMTSKHKTLIALLVAFLSAASPVLCQDREPIRVSSIVEAKLVTPSTRVLPGVPIEMWIELRNTSDTRVGVGLCADMFVVPPKGESFWITYGGEEREAYPTLLPEREFGGSPESYLLLKGRESRTVTLPFMHALSGPTYFSDPRLAGPGIYRIALRLDYCWPGFTVPSASVLPAEFTGAITTSTIEVERSVLDESDVAVWNRMMQEAKGQWVSTRWPGVIVSEILKQYPNSNYFPYAVAASADMSLADYAPLAEDALDRFPASPVLELVSEVTQRRLSTACLIKGRFSNACLKADAKVKASKRPTTRIRLKGREDVAAPPCPQDYDCKD